MNTTVAVVLVISFLLGLINQAISQGSVLGGSIKVPPTWLPWLTVAISFLGAAGTSIQGAGTITGQAILNAVVAGLMALGAAGGGVGLASHFNKKLTGTCSNCGKNPNVSSPEPSPPKAAA